MKVLHIYRHFIICFVTSQPHASFAFVSDQILHIFWFVFALNLMRSASYPSAILRGVLQVCFNLNFQRYYVLQFVSNKDRQISSKNPTRIYKFPTMIHNCLTRIHKFPTMIQRFPTRLALWERAFMWSGRVLAGSCWICVGFVRHLQNVAEHCRTFAEHCETSQNIWNTFA